MSFINLLNQSNALFQRVKLILEKHRRTLKNFKILNDKVLTEYFKFVGTYVEIPKPTQDNVNEFLHKTRALRYISLAESSKVTLELPKSIALTVFMTKYVFRDLHILFDELIEASSIRLEISPKILKKEISGDISNKILEIFNNFELLELLEFMRALLRFIDDSYFENLSEHSNIKDFFNISQKYDDLYVKFLILDNYVFHNIYILAEYNKGLALTFDANTTVENLIEYLCSIKAVFVESIIELRYEFPEILKAEIDLSVEHIEKTNSFVCKQTFVPQVNLEFSRKRFSVPQIV